MIRHSNDRSRIILVAAPLALAALCAAPRAAEAAPVLKRDFGTYFGGKVDEFAGLLAIDGAGNVYVAGTTYSADGIGTAGTHQPTHGGNGLPDGYLVKFDPAGERLWGTYFGGSDSDLVWGLAGGDEQIVIVGMAESTTGIATPGALQTAHAGGQDGFAAAFSPAGALLWATYLGTEAIFEQARAVAVDAQGGVYVGGEVNGNVPGLGTPGTHQPAHAGGQDGYVVKFDGAGARMWGTYYGQNSSVEFEDIAIGPAGEVYATGLILSADPTAVTADVHQTGYGGGLQDALLVRLTPTGERVWATYYGGDMQEFSPRVVAAKQGGVFLAGDTLSKSGFASADAYQSTHAGGKDTFLAGFDADGARVWGTYYGGKFDEDTYNFALDAAGALYVAGETRSIGGIATPDAFMPQIAGDNDCFVVKFGADGQRRWGTYYGGPETEGCVGVAVDGQSGVRVSGATLSPTGIASPGAFNETLNGMYRDAFVVGLSQQLGDACADAAQCPSGHCVDGVCCDSACGDGADDCAACSVAAGAVVDGTCTLVGPEVECRPSAAACDAAEVCSGFAAACPEDTVAADGQRCEGGLCEAGVCTPVEPDDSSTGDEPDSTGGDATSTGEVSTTGAPDPSTGDDSSGAPSETTSTGDPTAPDSSTGDPTASDSSTADPSSTSAGPPGDPDTGDAPTSGGPNEPTTASDASSSGGPAGDSDTAPGVDGCGCRTGSGPGGLLAGLLLLAQRRRRRAA